MLSKFEYSDNFLKSAMASFKPSPGGMMSQYFLDLYWDSKLYISYLSSIVELTATFALLANLGSKGSFLLNKRGLGYFRHTIEKVLEP